MPTLADYERDYGAEDRDEVLTNIRRYGTDDRSQWNQPQSQPQSTFHQQPFTGETAGQSTAGPTSNTGQRPAGGPAQAWNAQPQPPGSGGGNVGAPTAGAGQAAPGLVASAPASGAGQFDREAFKRFIMGHPGGLTPQMIEEAVRTNPQFAGVTRSGGTGGDKWNLPTGERGMDLIIDVGGRGQGAWTAGSGPGEAGGSGGGSGLQTGGGFQAGGAGVPGGAMGELYQELLNRSRQGLAVDRNDPAVRGQADAFSANVERNRRKSLADLAERSAPGTNLRGEERLGQERAGQATGGFEAELMGREIAARRDEIAQALQSRQGILTQQEQMALQRELAQLNAALQSRGLDLQGRSLDQSWQQALMQNDQFMNSLGLQAEDQASRWDAIRSGLM